MRFLVRLSLPLVIGLAFSGFHLFHTNTSAKRSSPEGIVCTPPPVGMVGWWPGEGNGDDIRGENNGSLENVGFAPGKVGEAFTFSGLRGVVVPDSPVFQVQRFTIDAWFTLVPFTCPNPGTCAAFILAKSGADGNSGYELDVREGGSLNFFINGGLAGGVVSSIGTFNDGAFHHVAATYDASVMKLFIDGQLNNQTNFSGTVNYPANKPLIIGGREFNAGTATTTYPGKIDEPEFFTRALSNQEIQAIFAAGSEGKCRPRCVNPPGALVSWWTGDDNPFDIWASNHGIAQGGLSYANGKVGRAFNFSGSGGVKIPAASNLNVGINSAFSIDAWIKPNNVNAQPIVEWNQGPNAIGVQFWVGVNAPGTLYANIVGVDNVSGATDSHIIESAPNIVKPGVFQHVVLTYDNLSQNARLFLNGVEVRQGNFDTSSFTPVTIQDLYIGRRPFNPAGSPISFDGLIDEVELFASLLSDTDIRDLNNAGSAGKCKPCIFPPISMVGWWNGDANTRDDSGSGNAGVLHGGATYGLGKVGQSFRFDGTGFVEVPDSSLWTFGNNDFTIDLWVNFATVNGVNAFLASDDGGGSLNKWIFYLNNGQLQFHINSPTLGPINIGSVPFTPSPGEWHHLAVRRSGTTYTFFIDGVPGPTASNSNSVPDAAAPLTIGQAEGSFFVNGRIDEVEIFLRALDDVEIQSLVAAGVSGKCKADFGVGQSPQAPQTVVLADTTITYNNVIAPGNTFYQTLGTYQVGPMPFGFSNPLHVADISGDVLFNGNARVCFNLQAGEFNSNFTQLKVLHLEGNDLVNRTSFSEASTRTLCADVQSLSPFVVTRDLTSPTAAAASISGRVTLPDGSPLAGAVMELSGAASRQTITDGEGRYSFNAVETAGFYTVRPEGANYSFTPRERSFSLLGNKTDAVFTAVPDTLATLNPLDTDLFFVRQQYLDFLGREPDAGGLSYWAAQLSSCGANAACLRTRRLEVSAAFFDSQEFQQTGSFIYRLYKAGLSRVPRYAEFGADRQQLVGGASLAAFSEQFVARPEFVQRYAGQTTAESFVDALLLTVQEASGVDLRALRAELFGQYQSGRDLQQSRARVLAALGQADALRKAEYNQAFVLMEYFGYLRRDPDAGGYAFWLDVLNNRQSGGYRGMVCAFITSSEYQQRFSSVVSHSNGDCGQ